MAQLFFLFWSAFVVALSGALMPGPVLTATISEVMKRGFWAGPLIVLGHAILELFVLAAVILGLAAWITQDVVMGVLGILGGALLILIGAHTTWTAKKAVEEALQSRADPRAAVRGPVLTGIVMSLSNPFWTLWWATIGLNYAAVALKSGVPGLVCFYSGHILSDLSWYALVSAAVASGRRICPPWVYRALIVFCGLVLVGLGAYFLATGLARFV
jgi:threonine/homoserine/homoserine lactone efflux protein